MPVSFVNGASAGSSGTIITTGSSGQVIPKAALPTGSVLQVVQTVKTDTFSTSATSMTDITGMSVSITPTSSTSKILIMISITVGQAGGNFAPVNLVRNSTNIAVPTTTTIYQGTLNSYLGEGSGYIGGSGLSNYVLNFLDSPATTSSTTYKLQIYTTGGTVYVNTRALLQNTSTVSSITAMEIAA